MISQTFTERCFTECASLASILTTQFVFAVLRQVARNTQAHVDDRTAVRVATYPAAARAVAWGTLTLGLAGALIIAGYNATHGAVLQGTIIAAAIVTVLVATVAEFTRVRVEWTDTGLQYSSPWSAPRRLRWEEIVGVTYSRTPDWFVVRGRGGTKIRLPRLLGGLGELFEEMKHRGSEEVRWQIERVTARSEG
jgi:hypothetical protein